MESRSYDRRAVPRSVKGTIESKGASQYNSSKRISLVCLIPSTVKIDGPVTGKTYVWDNAGFIVDVDEQDAGDLLQMHIGGRGCCGPSNPLGNKLFDLA